MFGDEAEWDAAERWVDDWQAGIEDRAAKARALSERIAGLSATARSRDGLVEVTVGPSGELAGLRLDDRVRRYSADWIAQQVLAVAGQAQQRLIAQVDQAAQETVGRDSAAGQAVVASFANRLGRKPAGGGYGTS